MLTTSPLVAKAAHFAQFAHAGQKRKYTGLPYFTHVYDVAKLVSSVTLDPDTLAAALLHDTLEDTHTTAMEILTEFGETVHSLVLELTDIYTPSHCETMSRTERKELEAERLATVSPHAQTIKLADLIDNTRSIAQFDPRFSQVYLREKERYLKALTYGSPELHRTATHILDVALKSLQTV